MVGCTLRCSALLCSALLCTALHCSDLLSYRLVVCCAAVSLCGVGWGGVGWVGLEWVVLGWAGRHLLQIEGIDEADKPLLESFALHCGHRFCNTCWQTGVNSKAVRWCTSCPLVPECSRLLCVGEKPPGLLWPSACDVVPVGRFCPAQKEGLAVVTVRCFEHGCSVVLPDPVVARFVSSALAPVVAQLRHKAFCDALKLSQCPSPGCKVVLEHMGGEVRPRANAVTVLVMPAPTAPPRIPARSLAAQATRFVWPLSPQ
jgi:hypothetical protein